MTGTAADNRRYSADRPADCGLCFFWNEKKEACRKKDCYYLEEVKEKEELCGGCPYGRYSPCIGYCLLGLVRELGIRI